MGRHSPMIAIETTDSSPPFFSSDYGFARSRWLGLSEEGDCCCLNDLLQLCRVVFCFQFQTQVYKEVNLDYTIRSFVVASKADTVSKFRVVGPGYDHINIYAIIEFALFAPIMEIFVQYW